MDGQGLIYGHFRILRLEREHLGVMAGGIPRQIGFNIDLERGDDAVAPTSGAGI